MTNKHFVFMTKDGRISLAGLNSAKVIEELNMHMLLGWGAPTSRRCLTMQTRRSGRPVNDAQTGNVACILFCRRSSTWPMPLWTASRTHDQSMRDRKQEENQQLSRRGRSNARMCKHNVSWARVSFAVQHSSPSLRQARVMQLRDIQGSVAVHDSHLSSRPRATLAIWCRQSSR
jgi:hypothetical protein